MFQQSTLCFGKISIVFVFSLTENSFCHFPYFPCAVGTLRQLQTRSWFPRASGIQHAISVSDEAETVLAARESTCRAINIAAS